jgi:hypothetical protein
MSFTAASNSARVIVWWKDCSFSHSGVVPRGLSRFNWGGGGGGATESGAMAGAAGAGTTTVGGVAGAGAGAMVCVMPETAQQHVSTTTGRGRRVIRFIIRAS